ncbi:hypothetical protein MTO96_036277 [Rhipicephalus appendiculatus]
MSPDVSCSSRDNQVSSAGPGSPPMTGQSSGDRAGTPSKAPFIIVTRPVRRRKRNKRTAGNKRREPLRDYDPHTVEVLAAPETSEHPGCHTVPKPKPSVCRETL